MPNSEEGATRPPVTIGIKTSSMGTHYSTSDPPPPATMSLAAEPESEPRRLDLNPIRAFKRWRESERRLAEYQERAYIQTVNSRAQARRDFLERTKHMNGDRVPRKNGPTAAYRAYQELKEKPLEETGPRPDESDPAFDEWMRERQAIGDRGRRARIEKAMAHIRERDAG